MSPDPAGSGMPAPPQPGRGTTSRLLRVTVGAMAATGLLGGLLQLGLGLLEWRSDPAALGGVTAMVTGVADLLAGPAFAILALLIVWRAADASGALFGGLFLSAYSMWGLALGNWYGSNVWLVAYVTAADWISHAAAVRFTQLFPAPLQRDDLRGLGTGGVGRRVAAGYALLLAPPLFWGLALLGEAMVRMAGVRSLYFAHVIAVCALAVGYLYASDRLGSEEDQQKIFWLLEGALVFLVVELLFTAIRLWNWTGVFPIDLAAVGPWLHTAQTWLALGCFALAIFYRGAFDSRLVVRRTTLASLVGMLAVLSFVTLETAVSETLTALFGFESQAGTIVGGVAVAVLLRPLTERIDRRLRGSGAGGAGEASEGEVGVPM